MSAVVYGLRAGFFFALANLLSSIQEDLHSRQDFIINPKDAVAVEPLRVIKLQYRHAKMNPPLSLDPWLFSDSGRSGDLQAAQLSGIRLFRKPRLPWRE